MSDFSNNTYFIEKNFNDFGPRSTCIGLVGRVEVTILDNLYLISKLLHGRIMTSNTILGGFKIYIERGQLKELIGAYQSLLPYKMSQDLSLLINTLRQLYHAGANEPEIGLDNRVISQIINVHNAVSVNIKKVWEGVISLRLISQSGFNKDVTFDGKQEILDTMLSKFTEGQMHAIKNDIEISGQLGGIKTARQADMKDMIGDMIFSRKDAYVTLNQMFYTTIKQRAILRKFRTDILFCPLDRYKELDAGLNIRTLVIIEKSGENDSKTILKPNGFEYAEFKMKNNSLRRVSFDVAGSINSGKITLEPYQEIELGGTSITIESEHLQKLGIEMWADIREYIGSGPSIMSLAIDGKLSELSVLCHFYYQIIAPVIPYMTNLVRRIQTSNSLQLCISKMPNWVQVIFRNLQPGYVYSGLLLRDPDSVKDRVLYVYMLTIMLPEFLLDPTFTFSEVYGTPPYIHEYGNFVQGLRRLYD